jgi:D-xylonolactonase
MRVSRFHCPLISQTDNLLLMSSTIKTGRLFNAPRCYLGESPRWAEDHWWWVDAVKGVVYWKNGSLPNSETVSNIGRRNFGVRVSMVQPVGANDLIVAVENSLRKFHFQDNQLEERDTLVEIPIPENWLLNDGTVDSNGNIWIGSVSPNRMTETGALLRINKLGHILEALPHFSLTNGMAWDHEKQDLYHVDSLERKVWRHHITVKTGIISRSEVFIELPPGDGLPDGISRDASGRFWLAVYGKSVIRSYDSKGAYLDEIYVPTEQVTSVAHGGMSGSQLLITTAREGFDEAQSHDIPLAGCLFLSEY